MGLPCRDEKCGSKTTSDWSSIDQECRICVTSEGMGLGGWLFTGNAIKSAGREGDYRV